MDWAGQIALGETSFSGLLAWYLPLYWRMPFSGMSALGLAWNSFPSFWVYLLG